MAIRRRQNPPRLAALLMASACSASAFFASNGWAGTEHGIKIVGMRYVPERLEVRPGDVVVWTNQDPFPHTVTFERPGPDSKEIPATGRWKMKVKAGEQGSHGYRCTLHPGMLGTLVVE